MRPGPRFLRSCRYIDSGLLIRSIRAVFNGQSILDPDLTQRALSWSKTRPTQVLPAQEQSLAPQEERVLALMAEGLTNKEIATTMQLSDKTVKNYIANMFQKLHISRRAQAAAFFVKRQGRRGVRARAIQSSGFDVQKLLTLFSHWSRPSLELIWSEPNALWETHEHCRYF